MLTLPLTFRTSRKEIFWFAFLMFFYIAAFLFLYQPFFLGEFTTSHRTIYIGLISGFTFLISLISYHGINSWWESVLNRWNLFYDLIWNLLHLGVIACFNYLITLQFPETAHLDFSTVLYATSLVGILPLSIDVVYRIRRMRNQSKMKNESPIVCAIASGNYVEIYSESAEEELKRDLMRISFVRFLESNNDLVQIHRSFAINPGHIEKIEGNSNGGVVSLRFLMKVPYSRKFHPRVTVLKSSF